MPVISNLSFSVTDTTIVATWNTDTSSDSNLTAGGKAAIDNGLAANSTSHQCIVTGLSPSSVYSCIVTSGGSSSSPQNVTTAASVTRTPVTSVLWCGTNGEAIGSSTGTVIKGDSVSTFVSNDNISYTIMNDGVNWSGGGNSNMMVGKLTDETYLRGTNVNGLNNFGPIANCTGTDGPGGLCMTNKLFGIFGMAGDLYLNAARQSGYTDLHGNIMRSTDKGATWNNWQNPGTFNANGVVPSPLGSFEFDNDNLACMMPVRYAVDDGTMGYNTAGNQIDGANGFWYFTYQTAGYVGNNNLFIARCPRIQVQLQVGSAMQFWHGPASPTPADFVNDTNWTSSSTGATSIYSQVNGFGSGGVSWDDLTFIPGLNRYFLINWFYPSAKAGDGTYVSVATSTWEFLEAPTPAGPFTRVGTMNHSPAGYFSPSINHRDAATNAALTNIKLKLFYSGDYVAQTYYHPTVGTLLLNPQGVAQPMISFVQATDNGASVNTPTATFSSNITAGSAIVVAGRFFDNASAIMTVTDTLGNTYRPVGLRGAGKSGAWVALNSPGGACTITISTGGTTFQIVACEYSGVASIRGIEWSTEFRNTSTGTTVYSAGTVNTLNNNDLIVGWFVDHTSNSTTYTAGPDFTIRKFATTGAVVIEDYILPIAGAHLVNINTSASTQLLDGGGIVLSATSVPVATFNRTFGGQAAASGTIVSAAFTVTTGNNIIVAVGIGNGHDPATSVSSITDTAGNTYTAITNAHASASTSGTQFYLAKNITGNAANVITATLTGSWPNTSLFAWEVVGSDPTSPIDQAVGKTGTSTTPNLNAFTPTKNGELILVSAHQFFGGINPFTPTGGYNYELNSPYPSPWNSSSTNEIAAAESTMQITAASTTPSWTTTHNVAWSVAAVSLFAAPTSSGGSGTQDDMLNITRWCSRMWP